MKAVLHTDCQPVWARDLGLETWALAPIAGRPVLEYWLELCDLFRISDVSLVLGDGALAVEEFVGDGARWGLKCHYSFAAPGEKPRGFLTRTAASWTGGLLHLSAPLFPRRLAAFTPNRRDANGAYVQRINGQVVCVLSDRPAFLESFVASGDAPADAASFAALELEPTPVDSLGDFFRLNQQMVHGESARYVRPGYYFKDGASIGYNVVIPPGAHLQPPLVIGNHTRLSALSTIGPDVIIGHHCLVDRQSDLSHCVILDGTYIGSNLEIRDKIVAGNRLIDPADGTVMEIGDPWLLSPVNPAVRATDTGRAVAGWCLALVLALLQLLPYLLLGGWHGAGRSTCHGNFHGTCRLPAPGGARPSFRRRLLRTFCLDRFPALLQVLAGRLWLCGQEPLPAPAADALRRELKRYFPAVFTYATPRTTLPDTLVWRVDASYYAYRRSLAEDLRILARAFVGRLLSGGALPAPEEPTP